MVDPAEAGREKRAVSVSFTVGGTWDAATMLLAVTHKEVVTAVVGASSALAGLVLVFLGVVLSGTEFAPGTKKAIVHEARRPAVGVLFSFGIGIACLSGAIVWLLYPRSTIYWATVVMFFAQLLSLCVATLWVAWSVIWGD